MNPLSHVSQIWSRATTALTNAPDVGSAMARTAPSSAKPDRDAHPGSPSPSDAPSATPFATLASSLQSVLLQLQSQPTPIPPGQSHPYAPPAGAASPAPGQPQAGSLSTTA